MVFPNLNANENDSYLHWTKNWVLFGCSNNQPTPAMIVCICNAVSDQQIEEAVDQGLTSLEAVRDELGVGNTCGTCSCEAERVLQAKLNRSLATQASKSTARPAKQIFL
jgi:bacterioferritin-associated ferredoxin